ncbi:MAG: hypothetical protein LBI85_05715 [Spirochaetaceae bacterium]|jgi:hypothetical protein|nr:hypothetical protein [Spirochaetaceae bacterium]
MFTIIAFAAVIAEAALFIWLGVWKNHIPLSFGAAGSTAYWLLAILLIALTVSLIGRRKVLCMSVSAVLYVLLLIIPLFLSSHMLNARRYAAQLKIPPGAEFKESDLPVFDPGQLPWVNEAQAGVLGDKLLGQLGAIGSSVVIGEYTRQEVNGKLYLVAPILHKGFFAYSRNPEGTPGYIMVSMTNSDDVRLITKIDGKDLRIRVQPEGHAAWGDKLERIIYSHAPTALRADWMFELDDTLHPYWVIPEYYNSIIWGAPEVKGIFVVDAESGEYGRYGIDEAPLWIDRIQPVEFIEEQLAAWGAYSGGYWNTHFGKVGLLQSDPGNALVYRDGDCYLFDSLTSYNGADESTVGFVLVNLRTKQSEYFNLSGADEWAAQVSALGDERIKPLRYNANFPLPVMVEGQPTYFFGLQDPQSRITKMFALVNIARHQVVGIGNTIQAAKIDYMVKMRSGGTAALNTPEADIVEISGVVERWGQYTQAGESYYSFVVGGAGDRILVAGVSQLEAPLTRPGDRVRVQAVKTSEQVWSVHSFDNLEISPGD